MNDPDLLEPAPARLPAQLWQPWTLVVPSLLLLPLIAIAFSWQFSPTTDEVLRTPRQHSKAHGKAHGKTDTPTTQTAPLSISMRLFVPQDGDKLHIAYAMGPGLTASQPENPQGTFTDDGKMALTALFTIAPKYFPKGTTVDELTLEESQAGEPAIAHVSLSEPFWNSDYWAMETRTYLAAQAIVHTLADLHAEHHKNVPLQVQLERDGHAVSVLGQLDVADPFVPDTEIVAPASQFAIPKAAVSAH